MRFRDFVESTRFHCAIDEARETVEAAKEFASQAWQENPGFRGARRAAGLFAREMLDVTNVPRIILHRIRKRRI